MPCYNNNDSWFFWWKMNKRCFWAVWSFERYPEANFRERGVGGLGLSPRCWFIYFKFTEIIVCKKTFFDFSTKLYGYGLMKLLEKEKIYLCHTYFLHQKKNVNIFKIITGGFCLAKFWSQNTPSDYKWTEISYYDLRSTDFTNFFLCPTSPGF